MYSKLLGASLAALAIASPAWADGPKPGVYGGIGSSASTYSGGEPVGGTYAINGQTGKGTFSALNIAPGATPSSPVNGDLWITGAGLYGRINGVTQGPFAPLNTCINAVSYGADPTGISASDSAWTAAIAAANPATPCIEFPAGTYKFTSSKALTLSNAYPFGSMTVKGAGSDLTKFSFASGVSGLSLSISLQTQSIHVRDISILAGGPKTAGTTTGLSLVQTQATITDPGNSGISDISGVVVRGADGYVATDAWLTAIDLNVVSNVNIYNSYVTCDGTDDGTTGINVHGTSTAIGVVYNLNGSIVDNCSVAFLYGNHIQGVTIVQSNFTGNFLGVVAPAGQTDGSQLAISTSQFVSYTNSIAVLSDMPGIQIVGNNFGQLGQLHPGTIISIAVANSYIINDNTFESGNFGTSNVINGIVIGPWSLRTGIISGNQFYSLPFGTAIILNTGSQFATVGTNTFATVGTTIQNLGTNNVVPVACSGSPTSSFAATAGIVTHC